jgi:hypothetical protein
VIHWSDPIGMNLHHVEQPNTAWKGSRPEPMHISREKGRE